MRQTESPGRVDWTDSLADPTAPARSARPLVGPLDTRIVPLAHGDAPSRVVAARLTGRRCTWSAASVAGSRLVRAACDKPATRVQLLASVGAPGSVFDPAPSGVRAGVSATLLVLTPDAALDEPFEANTHLFALEAPATMLAMAPTAIAELAGRRLPLDRSSLQLLRSASALFAAADEFGRDAAAGTALDRYLAALGGLVVHTTARSSGPSSLRPDLADAIRDDADALIYERATDRDLSAASIAEAMSISLRALYRAFDGAESPASRIRRRRLEHAAESLGRPGAKLDLGRLARDCGFGSAEYFSRAFAREFGMSPRAYRAAHRPPFGR